MSTADTTSRKYTAAGFLAAAYADPKTRGARSTYSRTFRECRSALAASLRPTTNPVMDEAPPARIGMILATFGEQVA